MPGCHRGTRALPPPPPTVTLFSTGPETSLGIFLGTILKAATNKPEWAYVV